MKIGLLDVDGHNFPNLAIMKLSAWHKSLGDDVEWYNGIEHYDRVYLSKVFSFTPDEYRWIQADEVIKGGSGYKKYDQWLPDEVEHICPDYSLYPMYKAAYGFLTRGCVNKCPFCIVPRKEWMIRKHADITEFIDGKKEAILMDNNVLASDWGLSQIEKIAAMKIRVDFNQGLDARIIARDKSIAKLLKKVKWISTLHLAFDNSNIKDDVLTTIAYLNEAGIPSSKLMFYVLTKEGEIEDAYNRVMLLDYLGCVPFVMPCRDLENNIPIDNERRRFARWVNMRAIFKTCDYKDYKE